MSPDYYHKKRMSKSLHILQIQINKTDHEFHIPNDFTIDEVTFVNILPGGMRAHPVPFSDRALIIPATI